MTAQTNQERLLALLHAHGQQFLSGFDIPKPKGEADNLDASDPESEEEWAGFESSSTKSTSDVVSDSEHNSDSEQEDDDFVAGSSCAPDVTVFVDSMQKRREVGPSDKELKKSFMSSKVSSVTSFSMRPVSKRKTPDAESEDDRTNVQNDALLHRLVHTRLLSGSHNSESELDHAKKGRALAGRVLELTGKARLGKGESIVRREQRNKAAKHIRAGLIQKQREKDRIVVEEAKNLGNYHPSLKRIYDTNTSARKRKRVRGLGIGVGKFVGGTLKLSRDEIISVTGSGNKGGGYRGIRQR